MDTLLAAATNRGLGGPMPMLALVLSLGFFALWALGVVLYVRGIARLFVGGHVVLGWLSIVVPFLGVAGYLALPKPGSTRHTTLDVLRRAKRHLPRPTTGRTDALPLGVPSPA